MSRTAQLAGLPETTSGLEQATRRTSGSWTVGAPTGCRDLRVLARENRSASHRTGRQGGSGAGSQQRQGTRHRGRVPVRLTWASRRVWSPVGGSAAGASRGGTQRAETDGQSAAGGPSATGEVEATGGVGRHLAVAYCAWPIGQRAGPPCRRHNPPSSSAGAGSTRCRRPSWTVNCRNGPPGAPRSRRTQGAPASGIPPARG